ncbi:MAG: exodeoxyribonuclease VII small subunit [Eubacteriales bacterium]
MAKLTFEQKIAKIDEIIEKLESNSSTLDESVKLYNEGTSLTAECQSELEEARLKITKIGSKAESE